MSLPSQLNLSFATFCKLKYLCGNAPISKSHVRFFNSSMELQREAKEIHLICSVSTNTSVQLTQQRWRILQDPTSLKLNLIQHKHSPLIHPSILFSISFNWLHLNHAYEKKHQDGTVSCTTSRRSTNGTERLSLYIMMLFSTADHLACTVQLSEKIMQSLPDQITPGVEKTLSSLPVSIGCVVTELHEYGNNLKS